MLLTPECFCWWIANDRACSTYHPWSVRAEPRATVARRSNGAALAQAQAAPYAQVISFDLGDMPWSRAADSAIRQAYPRFQGVVFGDSLKTIPRHKRHEKPLRCDAVFVDGSKYFEGRFASLVDLRAASADNAIVFMDEVIKPECLNGDYEAGCRLLAETYRNLFHEFVSTSAP